MEIPNEPNDQDTLLGEHDSQLTLNPLRLERSDTELTVGHIQPGPENNGEQPLSGEAELQQTTQTISSVVRSIQNDLENKKTLDNQMEDISRLLLENDVTQNILDERAQKISTRSGGNPEAGGSVGA